MSLFFAVLLMCQSICCQKSFSYPVIADVTRIDVVSKQKVIVKQIKDDAAIDSVIRFIDERRSRWCSPGSEILPVSGTLNFYKSEQRQGTIEIGQGFFVAYLAERKYVLTLSIDEQQSFFKLLQLEEAALFK